MLSRGSGGAQESAAAPGPGALSGLRLMGTLHITTGKSVHHVHINCLLVLFFVFKDYFLKLPRGISPFLRVLYMGSFSYLI